MKGIRALYLASARDFLRDRSSVLFVLLLPVAFAGFFGAIFGGGNHGTGGSAYYLPGLLGVALLWLGIFGTATPLVQQREAQLLRRLRVTPLTVTTLLGAQISWRVTVGVLQSLLFLTMGYYGFQVGIAGSPVLFAAAVILGALVFVSLGYLLAALARSTEGVAALGQLANFPMMFLSGSFFPIEFMPPSLRPVATLMPLTHLNDALRQLMAGAPAELPLWQDFALLAGWLVLFVGLAARLWRWE